MATQLLFLPQIAFASGVFAPGARARFFLSGTTTPVTVYLDTGYSTEAPSPLVADATGRFPQVFYNGPDDVRCTITTATDASIADIDPVIMANGVGETGFWVDDVAALLISDLSEAVEGDYVRTRAEGFSYEVAASDATDHQVTTAGGVKLYVLLIGGGHNVLAWGARRAEDDPTFDNSDVFDALTNYINSGAGDGSQRNILFPPGLYNHSRVFRVTQSRVYLQGLGSLSGSASFSPQMATGAHLCYTANDGGVGVDIGREPGNGFLYHFQCSNMRFGATGIDNKNQTIMRMRGCSEYYFDNVSWVTGNVLLEMAGCGIGHISGYYMSESTEAHILVSDQAGYEPFQATADTWFTNGNMWMGADALLKITGRFASRISFRDSWWERSKHMIVCSPNVDAVSSVERILFDNVTFQQDATYGAVDRTGWLLYAEASQSFINRQLRLDNWTFRDCNVDASGGLSGAAIEYVKGVNVSVNSFLAQLYLERNRFSGSGGYAVLASDTSASTANSLGSFIVSPITWVASGFRLQRLDFEFGRWAFKGNGITLPQTAPSSFVDADGQLWWNTSSSSLRVTKSGVGEHVALRAAGQSDSTATDVAALVTDFNNLLAKLRASGVIAT